MPIIVLGNRSSSFDNGNKIDTSLFVQKLYLGAIYIEAKSEEDIDLKIHFRIKKLPDPISIREAASKNYFDNKFNDPSIIENTTHVDFNDKNLNNVQCIKVNSFPTLEEQLTPKYYFAPAISNGVHESSLLRLDPYEKLKLDEQDSMVLNSNLTLPKTIKKLPTKLYVDNKFSDPNMIKTTAHVDFNDKNFDNVRFVKVNSMPAVRKHNTTKYYVDQTFSYWLDELSLLRLVPNEKSKVDEQDSIVPNSALTSLKTIIELPTKIYVDSLRESSRNRRDLSTVFNDQDNEIDNNKLINRDSITVNRNPSSDNELANRIYFDDSKG